MTLHNLSKFICDSYLASIVKLPQNHSPVRMSKGRFAVFVVSLLAIRIILPDLLYGHSVAKLIHDIRVGAFPCLCTRVYDANVCDEQVHSSILAKWLRQCQVHQVYFWLRFQFPSCLHGILLVQGGA